MTAEQFLAAVAQRSPSGKRGTGSAVTEGEYGMYLKGEWYALQTPASLTANADPVERLDVSILQAIF